MCPYQVDAQDRHIHLTVPEALNRGLQEHMPSEAKHGAWGWKQVYHKVLYLLFYKE